MLLLSLQGGGVCLHRASLRRSDCAIRQGDRRMVSLVARLCMIHGRTPRCLHVRSLLALLQVRAVFVVVR